MGLFCIKKDELKVEFGYIARQKKSEKQRKAEDIGPKDYRLNNDIARGIFGVEFF
jgi:hypothetical protein